MRTTTQAADNFVAAAARSGDVVVDETGGLSPGPPAGFDVTYHGHLPVFRARSPAERDHPFTVFDPFVSLRSAVASAVSAAPGGRVFVVAPQLLTNAARPNPAQGAFPPGYRMVDERKYEGIQPTLVAVYARSGGNAFGQR